MKFFSFLCSIALLAQSAVSLYIPTLEDAAATLEKRAVTVVKGVGGDVQPRLEIRQLQNTSPKGFTLFLLAMKQFQAQAQSAKTGYYQIAGIHGVPRVNWDGVGQCSTCTNVDGYCTHDSILFMAWHRAYLALFEQQVVSIAKQIANKYPSSTKASYVAAAAKLRLPYWDWAAKPASGNSLPQSITAAQVTVQGPSGSQTIVNPLHHHTFSSPSQMRYSPFTSWQNTLRYPTSNAADATSQESNAITAFNNIRASLQDQVYQLFSTCDTYTEVGLNTKKTSTNKCSNSLEGIHNTVHTTSGGAAKKDPKISGGHMTYLSTAAFDPIFWLHHCNVDRLFALWQGVYPNSYGGSQVAPHNTWTIEKGSTQDANSPLTPFHKDSSGDFWTTNGVRKWQQFGYTYPEYADSNGSKTAITNYIKGLYGPNADKTAGSSKRDTYPELDERKTAPLTAQNGSLFQYVANIETARYSLNGSYYIYLFSGNPSSEDPSSWIFDSSLIGPMGVLAQDAMPSDLVATGSVPLTRSLTDAVTSGALSALTEECVVPYLKKTLQWRIAGPDGQNVDPNSVPDFQVSVFASTAAPTSGLPKWSAFIPLADITKNKAGGATLQSITGAPSNATASNSTAST